MSATVFHGRNSKLLLQRNAGAYRAVPDPVAAHDVKFSTLDFGREPVRSEDPTVIPTALMQKRDEENSVLAGSLTSILCLNDIGHWLALLLGAPTTTGSGPYTHVFTLDLNPRPDALLELEKILPAGPTSAFKRYLGVQVNSMSWPIIQDAADLTVNLIGAEEVRPAPGAAFDAAPTQLTKNRACSKGGQVADAVGATLGKVTSADITLTNELEGQMLADNQEGYGDVLLGQPTITGNLSVLYQDAGLVDAAEAHASRAVQLISRNNAGDATLTVDLPSVEFDAPKQVIQSSKGLVASLAYRAHYAPGDDPVTITLVNQVASY